MLYSIVLYYTADKRLKTILNGKNSKFIIDRDTYVAESSHTATNAAEMSPHPDPKVCSFFQTVLNFSTHF